MKERLTIVLDPLDIKTLQEIKKDIGIPVSIQISKALNEKWESETDVERI